LAPELHREIEEQIEAETKKLILNSTSIDSNALQYKSTNIKIQNIDLPFLPDLEKLQIRETVKFDMSLFASKWISHLSSIFKIQNIYESKNYTYFIKGQEKLSISNKAT